MFFSESLWDLISRTADDLGNVSTSITVSRFEIP